MVLRLHTLIFFCIVWLSACAQPLPVEKNELVTHTLTYTLGETPVTLTLHNGGNPNSLFLIHLHDNENTAKQAALAMVEQYGGQLLSINNQQQRNISFQLNQQRYTFDPNRIFSDVGITASLKLLSNPAPEALKEIKGFAQFVLSHIPDSAIIVAVHNNTDERFSVLSYKAVPLKDETRAIHINDDHDIDDFILTTDITMFDYYKRENINAVLQSDEALTDDGSLSIFFGKRRRPYTNIETEHGHGLQQLTLLEKLYRFIGLEKKNFAENQ